MLDNKQSPLWPGSAKQVEIIATDTKAIKEENNSLIQENISLKKSLHSEQVLHNNIYKEWKELKELTREAELQQYKHISRPPVSKAVFTGLLVITSLLTIFTVYNLTANRGGTVLPKVSASASIDTSSRSNTPEPELHNFDVVSIESAKKEITPSPQVFANRSASNKELKITHSTDLTTYKTGTTVYSSNNSVGYKVKSKAYFYNQPDMNTRRNAFVIHWNNRYATLQPLDEKNGFIYVVFTNHAGQTSKGWLMKSDLYMNESR